MIIKTEEEIELIKESSLLVGKTLGEVSKVIGPGVVLSDLDKLAETFIRDNGAVPGFKGLNGFPASLCISLNEAVVHGIPTSYVLKEGDIVSVDCGVLKNDFFGDSAYTFAIGNVSDEIRNLLNTTKSSLYKGIEKAIAGNRIGDIGHSIQTFCEDQGYSVVRELVGHGLGRSLHESPEVPNYGRRGKGTVLPENLVIAIEPMINLGKRSIKQLNDGWTIVTKDGLPSAHFEHTIVVRKNKAEVLSTFEFIKGEN